MSWYQDVPRASLEMIEMLPVSPEAAILDVGGGASNLVVRLVEQGFADLSVLDVSEVALAEARGHLDDDAPVVWLHVDLLSWRPERQFDLWHDRAVFHFLVASEDRETYLRTLRFALSDNGFVVLGTFAPDGPESCSGLPVVRYSASDLAELLGAEFDVLDSRREEHITPSGAIQPFTWVAAQMRLT